MAKVILENVRVDFPIYGAQQRSLRTAIVQRATGGLIHREGRHKERVIVRALSDVSLRLEEGDRLGLIGHNGSGKSTLLKVIAGIYEPIAGTRIVEGRVTPLFDMMPGLDPEDTGYENILTSGMLLGMSRDQVESKIPEIEEFSELGEYLALPMRTYSAGMTMRTWLCARDRARARRTADGRRVRHRRPPLHRACGPAHGRVHRPQPHYRIG